MTRRSDGHRLDRAARPPSARRGRPGPRRSPRRAWRSATAAPSSASVESARPTRARAAASRPARRLVDQQHPRARRPAARPARGSVARPTERSRGCCAISRANAGPSASRPDEAREPRGRAARRRARAAVRAAALGRHRVADEQVVRRVGHEGDRAARSRHASASDRRAVDGDVRRGIRHGERGQQARLARAVRPHEGDDSPARRVSVAASTATVPPWRTVSPAGLAAPDSPSAAASRRGRTRARRAAPRPSTSGAVAHAIRVRSATARARPPGARRRRRTPRPRARARPAGRRPDRRYAASRSASGSSTSSRIGSLDDRGGDRDQSRLAGRETAQAAAEQRSDPDPLGDLGDPRRR